MGTHVQLDEVRKMPNKCGKIVPPQIIRTFSRIRSEATFTHKTCEIRPKSLVD